MRVLPVLIWFRIGFSVGLFEYGNELLVFIKVGILTSYCQLSTKTLHHRISYLLQVTVFMSVGNDFKLF
jgi:hypothetical protein